MTRGVRELSLPARGGKGQRCPRNATETRGRSSDERVRLEDRSCGATFIRVRGEKPARKLEGLTKLRSRSTLGSHAKPLRVINPYPLSIPDHFLAVRRDDVHLTGRGSSLRDRTEGEAETGWASPGTPGVTDYLFAVLSIVALGYTLVVFDEFVRRAARPETLDLVFGLVTILLVLEATRRTVGWILPLICVFFIAYAYLGALIPDWARIGHVGYGPNRIVGQTYMGLDGLFGVPLDGRRL